MPLHNTECKREQGEEIMMIKMHLWTRWIGRRLLQERGAGLAEYALLLFVVAVAAATVVTAFGADIIDAFSGATDALPTEVTQPIAP
jgi:Flp pilus assembly pilin Flp